MLLLQRWCTYIVQFTGVIIVEVRLQIEYGVHSHARGGQHLQTAVARFAHFHRSVIRRPMQHLYISALVGPTNSILQ